MPVFRLFRLLSYLESMPALIDTVEVRSSSLLVPTISFNGLPCRTSVPEAPNGSIKRAEPGG